MTPKQRQDWIFEQLKIELVTYSEMFRKYLAHFGKLTQPTFTKDWERAKAQYEAYITVLNEAKAKAILQQEAKGVKAGIKLKQDRILIYQREVDKCIEELNSKVVETVIIKGKPEAFKRDLTIQEKTQLRNTIKNLQSEISKIEGDYAKVDINISQDKAINVTLSPSKQNNTITLNHNGANS